jgi:sugar-phosphatase
MCLAVMCEESMRLICTALLFDLDGVLIDSTARAEHAWTRWAVERGLDPACVLALASGRRTVDVIGELLPARDARAEAAIVARYGSDSRQVTAGAGAAELLPALPPERWAIVTSSPGDLAVADLVACGLPVPGVLIGDGDVPAGKPDPRGYRLAARRLGVPVAECVVIEDSPSGIQAGRAAGARVVAVSTTHERGRLAEADVCLCSLRNASVQVDGGSIAVTVRIRQ